MTPHEIKVEIYKRRPNGVTVASIARSLGVTRQSVAYVIEGRSWSQRIAEAVASAIDLPIDFVFPRNETKTSYAPVVDYHVAG